MASTPHHKRILVASGASERKPGRIIRGFERITILLKPLNKSHGLPSELLPAVKKLDRKRVQRPWLAIILVFPVVILFKVQLRKQSIFFDMDNCSMSGYFQLFAFICG